MQSRAPVLGDLRVTVPVDAAQLVTSKGDEVAEGRYALSDEVDIVVLDQAERERFYEQGFFGVSWRLELFGLLDESRSSEAHGAREARSDSRNAAAEGRAAAAVARLLSLAVLVVREPLFPAAVVVDRFDPPYWRREDWLSPPAPWDRGHGWGSYTEFPAARISTWAVLMRRWPLGRTDLDLALQYYAESVIDSRDRRFTQAVVSASIATEVLVGGGHAELTHRVSTRGAHLVSTGERAAAVAARLKTLYNVRSSTMHAGKQATGADATAWQQFLMAALPRAAAYPGTLDQLRAQLDRASFVRSPGLGRITDGPDWWTYCDFAGLLLAE